MGLLWLTYALWSFLRIPQVGDGLVPLPSLPIFDMPFDVDWVAPSQTLVVDFAATRTYGSFLPVPGLPTFYLDPAVINDVWSGWLSETLSTQQVFKTSTETVTVLNKPKVARFTIPAEDVLNKRSAPTGVPATTSSGIDHAHTINSQLPFSATDELPLSSEQYSAPSTASDFLITVLACANCFWLSVYPHWIFILALATTFLVLVYLWKKLSRCGFKESLTGLMSTADHFYFVFSQEQQELTSLTNTIGYLLVRMQQLSVSPRRLRHFKKEFDHIRSSQESVQIQRCARLLLVMVNCLVKEVGRLSDEKIQLEQRLAAAEGQVSEHQAIVDNLDNKIEVLERAKEEASAEESESLRICQDLQQQLSDQMDNIRQLKEEKSDLEADLASAQSLAKSIRVRPAELEKANVALMAEQKRLKQNLQSAENEVQVLQNKLNRKKTQSNSDQALQNVRAELNTREGQLKALKQNLEQVTTEKSTLEKGLSTARKSLNAAESAAETARSKHNRLVSDLNGIIDAREQKLKDTQELLAGSATIRETLFKEKEQYYSELRECRTDRDKVFAALESVQTERDEARSSLESIRQQQSQLTQEHTQLEEKLQESEKKLAAAKTHLGRVSKTSEKALEVANARIAEQDATIVDLQQQRSADVQEKSDLLAQLADLQRQLQQKPSREDTSSLQQPKTAETNNPVPTDHLDAPSVEEAAKEEQPTQEPPTETPPATDSIDPTNATQEPKQRSPSSFNGGEVQGASNSEILRVSADELPQLCNSLLVNKPSTNRIYPPEGCIPTADAKFQEVENTRWETSLRLSAFTDSPTVMPQGQSVLELDGVLYCGTEKSSHLVDRDVRRIDMQVVKKSHDVYRSLRRTDRNMFQLSLDTMGLVQVPQAQYRSAGPGVPTLVRRSDHSPPRRRQSIAYGTRDLELTKDNSLYHHPRVHFGFKPYDGKWSAKSIVGALDQGPRALIATQTVLRQREMPNQDYNSVPHLQRHDLTDAFFSVRSASSSCSYLSPLDGAQPKLTDVLAIDDLRQIAKQKASHEDISVITGDFPYALPDKTRSVWSGEIRVKGQGRRGPASSDPPKVPEGMEVYEPDNSHMVFDKLTVDDCLVLKSVTDPISEVLNEVAKPFTFPANYMHQSKIRGWFYVPKVPERRIDTPTVPRAVVKFPKDSFASSSAASSEDNATTAQVSDSEPVTSTASEISTASQPNEENEEVTPDDCTSADVAPSIDTTTDSTTSDSASTSQIETASEAQSDPSPSVTDINGASSATADAPATATTSAPAPITYAAVASMPVAPVSAPVTAPASAPVGAQVTTTQQPSIGRNEMLRSRWASEPDVPPVVRVPTGPAGRRNPPRDFPANNTSKPRSGRNGYRRKQL